VHCISVVRKVEVHRSEPLVLGPSQLEVETTVAMLKKYKSPGSVQILAELIQAGGVTLLILYGKSKNFLISGRSLLVY
jgi:hypothetical protein